MNDPILDGIQEAIRAVFRNPTIVVDAGTTAEDVDGWDSLAHAHLIIALEERFGMSFPAEHLFDINCVGELAALIAAGQS